MKKILLLPILLIMGLLSPALAQNTVITFPVAGNCNMCKKRIESALDVKGVKNAEWNVETKMLSVKYQPTKITEEDIKKLVAKSGYDTPGFVADSTDYNKLPGCCHYRDEQSKDHPQH